MNRFLSEEEYKDFSRRIWDRSTVAHLPTRVQFEITYRCNIHCVHCYTDPFNNSKDIRRELSLNEMLHLFDELVEAGVLWMLLTGGEAFTHPQFKQIYREAKARGFIVTIFSNATTITEELADFLKSNPPFGLEISCHGATSETFDRITKIPGSFIRFKEGIRRLKERKIPFTIKTKAMTLNRGELPQIKAFVENLGLNFRLYSSISPRLDGDISSTQYRLSPEEIIELEYGDLLSSEDLSERCDEENSSSDSKALLEPPSDDRLFRCGCGTNSLTISPHGILRSCTFTTWPAYDLRQMPVREAFNQLVETIREARYKGESLCRVCPVYLFCQKNPVSALRESGSMEAPITHLCDVAYGRAEKEGRVFVQERNAV